MTQESEAMQSVLPLWLGSAGATDDGDGASFNYVQLVGSLVESGNTDMLALFGALSHSCRSVCGQAEADLTWPGEVETRLVAPE